MLPSSIGRSDCSSALDIETSFPVPGLGGLGDGRKMLLLQWTGTTQWPHKSAKRYFVKWASVSYSSTGMNKKRRAVKAKTSQERFSGAQCLCGAKRAQLAQTVKTWGIESLLRQASACPTWIPDLSLWELWEQQAELGTGPFPKQ